jgi:hypothetical protein
MINEQSTAYLTITFKDENGDASQPSSSTYQIHDEASGTEIQSETALSPTAGVATLTLTPAFNTIINSDLPWETRIVTIHGEYAGGQQINEICRYRVKNLGHIG